MVQEGPQSREPAGDRGVTQEVQYGENIMEVGQKATFLETN